MATIIDVARRAAVSIATVSRAISQPELVSEVTRERVGRAIRELGYEPNRAARTLRTLRSSKLLVMVPDISNPFFGQVIRGAEEAARGAGYSVMLGDTRDDPALEAEYSVMLRRREVDGLIFLSHRLPRGLEPLLASAEGAVPVVNGCEYSPELGLSSVHIDNAGAACAAIDHLLDLDHRRIGVITGSLESPLSRDRLSGVELAMRRRGPPCHLHVQRGDFSVDSGFCGAQRLINERCSAIFCFSDEMAIGALQAVREAGLNCPADISVIGFDDVRFVRYLHPPLTTIAQPAYEIGKRTVELLLDTIEGRLTSPQTVVMPYQLLVRASTAPRAKK